MRNALEMAENTTVAGDFDGDGVDEMAAFYGRNQFLSLIYWENNNGKFDIQGGSVVDTSVAFSINNFEGQVAAGDFDGDGTDEMFAIYNYNGQMGWWVFQRKADGSFNHYLVGKTGTLSVDSINNRLAGGDFDGDGMDEIGILYDHPEHYPELLILDRSSSGTFSHSFVGRTGAFHYGAMKGLISAGDYDGDGVDEMMGLFGYEQTTSSPHTKMWIFERTSTGGFNHYSSDTIQQLYTSRIAYCMVSGKFTSTSREMMAGIHRAGVLATVWAFGRPTDSTWYYKVLA